jgi:hypothetical protein
MKVRIATINRRLLQPVAVVAVGIAVATAAAQALQGASQQAPPTFRSTVELLEIDAQVTPAKDAPLRELAPKDFNVTIQGRSRPVVGATFLHYDDRAPVRNPPPNAASDACVFGFHRRVDRVTAHYLVAVDRSGADRIDVKEVRVKPVDKAFTVLSFAWRSPVRKQEPGH